jgi:HTH-type transcriptional regulator, sugar sensing transcriptional regulator
MSEKEASIYLAILELGSASASTIARRAGIKRTTTYGVLKDMVTKNTISLIEKNWITYFQAIEPTKLLQKMKDNYDIFEKNIPWFISIANVYSHIPKITYYEGISGLKDMYNWLLSHQNSLLSFLSDDDIAPELKEYLNWTFIQQRKKHGISASVIVRNTQNNIPYVKATKNDPLTKVRLLEDNFVWLEGEIILFWKDSVACALYSPTELIWYIIQSKQLYSSLKAIFMFIWDKLPWKPKG